MMMKHFVLMAAAVAALIAGTTSCEKMGNKDNPYKSLELSTKSREFARAGNNFAFDFLDRVSAVGEGSFMVSPLSVQFLLGMMLNGARGATADEIAGVLGYGAGEVDAVNEYCQAMLKQLPGLDRKTRLAIADAFAVKGNFMYQASYLEVIKKYYEAEIFDVSSVGGADQINKWCSARTNGMIPKIVDMISRKATVCLLNAMYFKSEWSVKFPVQNTKVEPFLTASGVAKWMCMMKNEHDFLYQDNDLFRAVRLPYGNGAFSMTVILPSDGKTLADVTAALDAESWEAFEQSMVTCQVDLWLPRFETRYHAGLNSMLSSMGMLSAFTEDADFSGISKGLCLDEVNQDTVIKVDEAGTEAAVVSHAGYAMAAPPGEHIVFHADRPFLYLITEKSSGAVLFAGRYMGD